MTSEDRSRRIDTDFTDFPRRPATEVTILTRPSRHSRRQVELDGDGVAAAAQGRCEGGGDRAAIERGNDHDLEVDRRGVAHGGLDARIELAIASQPWEEATAR